jgi:hypothetical protein
MVPGLRLLLYVVPPSAASERVFSLFQNAFTDAQESILEDKLECTLFRQYNGRAGRDACMLGVVQC